MTSVSLPKTRANQVNMNTLLACVNDAEVVVEWIHKVHGVSIVQGNNLLHVVQLIEKLKFDLAIVDEKYLDKLDDASLVFLKKTKVIVLGKGLKGRANASLNIIDFCPKPVQFPRLMKALSKVFKVRGGTSIIRTSADSLRIKSDGVLINMKLEEICCLESMRDYVLFHTEEHRFIVHSTLKSVQDLLVDVPDFIQIHRSYVVNSVKICEKSANSVKVCDHIYPVSRTNRHKLKYLMLD